MSPNLDDLTPREADALLALIAFLDARAVQFDGKPAAPTCRELGQAMTPPVNDRRACALISALCRKGYLRREGRRARAVTVLRRST